MCTGYLFWLQKYLPLTLNIKAAKIKTKRVRRKLHVILVAYLGGHIQRSLMVVCAVAPPDVCISNIFQASKYQLVYCTVCVNKLSSP